MNKRERKGRRKRKSSLQGSDVISMGFVSELICCELQSAQVLSRQILLREN